MNSPTHTIDPDGEVLLILRNANSPFAHSDKMPFTSLDSKIVPSLCDSAPITSEGTEKEPELSVQEEQSKEGMERTSELISPNEEATAEEHIDEEAATEGHLAVLAVQNCLRIKVSAKHLMFASPVFKKTLTGGWKESMNYSQKGSTWVTADGWDIEAFMIVLRAIHGQHYLIAQKLSLEMLAKVTVIADYYECKNALYLLKDMWIKNVKGDIPTTLSRDLILWLWIAWFFELPAQFSWSTSMVMSQSDKPIDILGLPIPGIVIASMNVGREAAINDLIAHLHQTRDAYLNNTRGCSFECRSIMCGALTIHMQSSNLLLPKPDTPFPGLSYNGLVQTVHKFRSPAWYNAPKTYSTHACFHSSFESLFAKQHYPLEGLELKNFTFHDLVP
ncbi:uncharacterized protein N7503_003165 [Penicillium pulvis]|uniref:uncharacterized protein n=1 Tax=Penicillium pulvis TaxID=1562058 RepID=UPI0025478241|nr:uncharacterized protein N7503_003165 [Penicillium pulvis]KAJ5805563.1 hypothetical protein N7503_003165 [Penicillium pulvis]